MSSLLEITKEPSYKAAYRSLGDRRVEDYYEADKVYQRNRRLLNPLEKSLANKKYREENKEKIHAHNTLNHALQRGEILREPCKVCGKEKSHGHHTDYLKALEVIWLCSIHHKLEHKVEEKALEKKLKANKS